MDWIKAKKSYIMKTKTLLIDQNYKIKYKDMDTLKLKYVIIDEVIIDEVGSKFNDVVFPYSKIENYVYIRNTYFHNGKLIDFYSHNSLDLSDEYINQKVSKVIENELKKGEL
jgi:hypothetical protein